MRNFNPDREIRWYRTPLDPEVLKSLNERSDFWGMMQSMGYLLTCVTTGVLAYQAWVYLSWPWVVGAVFLHGTVCAFMINAVHELVHGTVFKTRWLNAFFGYLFAFFGWINHKHFWGSHSEHHKFTLHQPDDLEVTLPIKLSLRNYLRIAIVNVHYKALYGMIRNQARLASGRFQGDWETHLFPEEAEAQRREVMTWSWVVLTGHVLITTVSLAMGQWIVPILVSLTPLYGKWLQWLCNNTQHSGLVDDVSDFRLSCRTVYLDPITQFLYWHMNYHIEHHMYAGVPCYNLAKLHRAIKHDLPYIPNGLMESWVQIGHIMNQQEVRPGYQYRQPLPGEDHAVADTIKMWHGDLGAEQVGGASGVQPATPAARPRVDADGVPYRKWECSVCGFIYDEAKGLPEEGLAPGTRWAEIPEDWSCPDCGVAKSDFKMIDIGPSDAAAEAPVAPVPDQMPADHAAASTSAAVATTSESPLREPVSPVVIVGSGLAGYTLARSMRQLGSRRPITVITRDDGAFYSKPMLSNAWAEGLTPQTLAKDTPVGMAEKHQLDVRPDTRVTRIDREGRVLHTDRGEVPYGDLVLAIGAEQIVLPLEGDAAHAVHRVNDRQTYAAFREALPEGGRVLIIGAGLIGCEFANDLIHAGYPVELVDLAPAPLNRLVPPEVGRALADALAERGVRFHFETAVRSVNRDADGRLACELATGETRAADVVLFAVGLRPNTQLAREAGLNVNRGVVVTREMQTSDPRIFALGDCAECGGVVRPFILPLFEAARALAHTLTGQPTPVQDPPMPVVVKTPACPLVVCPPEADAEGAWTVEGEGPNRVARFRDAGGRLTGFALSGDAVDQKDLLVRELATPEDYPIAMTQAAT